ncbi:NUDIX domain-containing protein [Candidatus Uhrbacteria bacterium]|nr:NUDIX domain-containing protein [Candidatus Uhrbacteria bacterium]
MAEPRFRPNVAGILLNKNGAVLLIRRKMARDEHWQLPQGGIDAGETLEQAIRRECREEVGTDNFTVLKVLPDFHRYEWPKGHPRYGYDGQSQTIFILQFQGTDAEIKIDEDEASGWKWYSKDDAIKTIYYRRRPSFERAVKEIPL